MARMEFAILHFLEGSKRIALRREQDQVLERLKARTHEILGKDSRDWQDIERAIDKAFKDLVKEFMDETITMV